MKRIKRTVCILLALVAVFSLFTISVSADAAIGKVTNLRVTETDDNELDLSWRRVSGAKGYKVYLRTIGGTWALTATTDKTSCDIENLTSAKGYQVRVRAFTKVNGKTVNGEYSTIVTTATEPDDVSNLKASTVKNGKTVLTWNKVRRADGYEIYRQSATGSWSKVKTTQDLTVSVKASAGTRFKVRAYFVSEGVTYKSDFEKVTVPAKATTGLISESEAKAIALKDAGFAESEVTGLTVELTKDDGISVYEVEFIKGKYEYDYEINAKTGAIIESDREYYR